MGIIEAIVAIGAIFSAIFGIYKLASWQLTKTPQEKEEDIAKKVDDKHEHFKKTGRPKWD